MKIYFYIILKWITISFLIGFGLAILGLGQGGASVVFVVIAIIIGSIGAAIHTLWLSIKNGNTKHIIIVVTINACLLFWVSLVIIDDQHNTLDTAEQARHIALEQLRKEGKPTEFLSKGINHKGEDGYHFDYQDGAQRWDFWVLYGKLYRMPYDN